MRLMGILNRYQIHYCSTFEKPFAAAYLSRSSWASRNVFLGGNELWIFRFNTPLEFLQYVAKDFSSPQGETATNIILLRLSKYFMSRCIVWTIFGNVEIR
jgi:hypothetical protein